MTIALMHETLSLAAWHPVVTNLLIGGFLIVSLAMILLVLIQRPQGGGLSGAFGAGGGGGAGQTAFGTKTGDVLTWSTITIFVCFLLLAIVLNFATRPQTGQPNPTIATSPRGATPAQTTTTGETAGDQPGDETAPAGENTDRDAPPPATAEQPTQEQPTDEPPGADQPADQPTDQPADQPPGADL